LGEIESLLGRGGNRGGKSRGKDDTVQILRKRKTTRRDRLEKMRIDPENFSGEEIVRFLRRGGIGEDLLSPKSQTTTRKKKKVKKNEKRERERAPPPSLIDPRKNFRATLSGVFFGTSERRCKKGNGLEPRGVAEEGELEVIKKQYPTHAEKKKLKAIGKGFKARD